MYLDKPLKEHRLLQAIARTNRPYKDLKKAGLNWELINQECQSQSAASGVPWEDALYQNLLDLKTKLKTCFPLRTSAS
jgi:type I site-specific restriction-modification system R (restriction) subunit